MAQAQAPSQATLVSSTPAKPRREPRRWLSAPGILFLALVTQIPFVLTIYYSFRGWNLLRPESNTVVGLRNYVRTLQNSDFYQILWHTILLTGSVVIITLIFGLIFALLLNRPFRGQGVARTMLIAPFLIMPVVTAVLWKNVLLDPVFGFSAFSIVHFWAARGEFSGTVPHGIDHRHRLLAMDSICDADPVGRAAIHAGVSNRSSRH